ncbi:MAG: NADH-quinone oxidoreductase subunit N [Gemmataceae bacterium]
MLPKIEIDVFQSNLVDFLPEGILCLGIVALLVARLFRTFDRSHLGALALLVVLGALLVSVLQALGRPGLDALLTSTGLGRSSTGTLLRSLGLDAPPSYQQTLLFGGMMTYDFFTVYMRVFLLTFCLLVIWLTRLTGIPDREDSADFYVLLLGATLGMSLMASATHLLMVFLAVEMASLPSYALSGFLKGRRQSSEAALKYVVYGAGSAGIMLYGISLLAGKFGTGYLPELATLLVASFQPGHEGVVFDPVVVLGTLFLLIGVAFKIASVPFHFWAPDVFEGASAEVAGFLSVASKGAALALLARLSMFLGGLDPLMNADPHGELPYLAIIRYLVPVLAFFAALTATFGNLAAYQQTNLKRLLAYSSIAHAGYMLMALSTLTRNGVEAMLFYLIAYLFMNLGAFAVVAFLRNQARSEDLTDFRGLVRRSPVMVIALAVFLLSLLGLPPLVGFAAKFQVFAALYQDAATYRRLGEPGLAATLLGLLIVGGLNTVLSAFYYLKVLKVMILDHRAEDLEGTEPPRLVEPTGAVVFVSMLAALVFGLGILWGPLGLWTERTVARFRIEPGLDVVRSIAPENPPNTPAGGPGMGPGGGGPPGGGRPGAGGPGGGRPGAGGPGGGRPGAGGPGMGPPGGGRPAKGKAGGN